MNRTTNKLFKLLAELSISIFKNAKVEENFESVEDIKKKAKQENIELPECMVIALDNLFDPEFSFETHFEDFCRLNDELKNNYTKSFNYLKNYIQFEVESSNIVKINNIA